MLFSSKASSISTTNSSIYSLSPSIPPEASTFISNLSSFVSNLSSIPKNHPSLLIWSTNLKKEALLLLNVLGTPSFQTLITSPDLCSKLYLRLLDFYFLLEFFIVSLRATWPPPALSSYISNYSLKFSSFLSSFNPDSLFLNQDTVNSTAEKPLPSNSSEFELEFDFIDYSDDFAHKPIPNTAITQNEPLSSIDTDWNLVSVISHKDLSLHDFISKNLPLNSNTSNFFTNISILIKADGQSQLLIEFFNSATSTLLDQQKSPSSLITSVNSLNSQFLRLLSFSKNLEKEILDSFFSDKRLDLIKSYFLLSPKNSIIPSQNSLNQLRSQFNDLSSTYLASSTCFYQQQNTSSGKELPLISHSPSAPPTSRKPFLILKSRSTAQNLNTLVKPSSSLSPISESRSTVISTSTDCSFSTPFQYQTSENSTFFSSSLHFNNRPLVSAALGPKKDSTISNNILSISSSQSSIAPTLSKHESSSSMVDCETLYPASAHTSNYKNSINTAFPTGSQPNKASHKQNLSLSVVTDLSKVEPIPSSSTLLNHPPSNTNYRNQHIGFPSLSPVSSNTFAPHNHSLTAPLFVSQSDSINHIPIPSVLPSHHRLSKSPSSPSMLSNRNPLSSFNHDASSQFRHDRKPNLNINTSRSHNVNPWSDRTSVQKDPSNRFGMLIANSNQKVLNLNSSKESPSSNIISFPTLNSASSLNAEFFPTSPSNFNCSFPSFTDADNVLPVANPSVSEFDPYSSRRTFLKGLASGVSKKSSASTFFTHDPSSKRKPTSNSFFDLIKKSVKSNNPAPSTLSSKTVTTGYSSNDESSSSDYIFITSPTPKTLSKKNTSFSTPIRSLSNGSEYQISKSHSFNVYNLNSNSGLSSPKKTAKAPEHKHSISYFNFLNPKASRKSQSFSTPNDKSHSSSTGYVNDSACTSATKRNSGYSTTSNRASNISVFDFVDINMNLPEVTETMHLPTPRLRSQKTIVEYAKKIDSDLGDLSSASKKPIPKSLQNALKPDYTDSDIVILNGRVISGTLAALIEYMTPHNKSVDSKFVHSFLLTFRNFCTPLELTTELFNRFNMEPPQEIINSEELYELWRQKKQTPARLRVCNVFKTWIESYFYLDEDMEYIRIVESFFKDLVINEMSGIGKRLLSLIHERKLEYQNIVSGSSAHINKSKAMDLMFMSKISKLSHLPDPPEHQLSKKIIYSLVNSKHVNILDIHPLEMARQITLRESHVFCSIRPRELVERNINRNNKAAFSNITKLTTMSNELAHWVISNILSESNTRSRALVLKYMIQVAYECFSLKNFDSVFLFVSAFNSSQVARLNKTKALLSARYKKMLQDLQKVADSSKNYSYYRTMLSKIAVPAIPFLGIILTDLTFNNDGNPKFCKTNSMPVQFTPRPPSAKLPTQFSQLTEISESRTLHARDKMRNGLLSSQTMMLPNRHSRMTNEYSNNVQLSLNKRTSETVARRIVSGDTVGVVGKQDVHVNLKNKFYRVRSLDELGTLDEEEFGIGKRTDIIETVQKFQVPYNLQFISELEEYLETSFKRCEEEWNEDQAYQKSLELEPRVSRP
ncbi:hypothetical protein BB560_001210 [Smittium megazygosporum]|uniref:Ras-GEF domain-containing protein n=2 Tax=Smittium megazygosporum TaxID=133381 RepID=A0A2T9ZI66_9FUNG|nr:hypothetical protein BB560_001210 [Smittium megazygosporum]